MFFIDFNHFLIKSKGYYNPFARYTLQDYKNLKSNQGLANPARFGFGSKEFDPETKTEKVSNTLIRS